MTPHFMEDPADLDPFSPEQIDLTRKLDIEKDGTKEFSRSLLGALSSIHGMMAMVSLPHFQRGAYEAHMRHQRTGEKSDLLVARALWRTVEYMQAVRKEAMKQMEDPDVRKALGCIGEKMGIDLLGLIEREKEE